MNTYSTGWPNQAIHRLNHVVETDKLEIAENRGWFRNNAVKRKILVMVAITTVIVIVWYRISPHDGVRLCYLGDIRDRFAGKVPDNLKSVHLDARAMSNGIGNAAIGGWSSLGDAAVVAGRAWLKTTQQQSPNYYRPVSNRYFQSSHLAYLEPGARPAGSLKLMDRQPLEKILIRLARGYPDGVFVTGYVLFDHLYTIAIAKPAIASQPIMKHPAYYYTQPMSKHQKAWGYIIVIAAKRQPRLWWQRRAGLERVLPLRRGSGKWYLSLSRVLLLRHSPIDFGRPPAQKNIIDIAQPLARSQAVFGQLQIFPVKKIVRCRRAIAG